MGNQRRVVAKASEQGGYISRDQLMEIGMTTSSIDRRVRGGDLRVVTHGIYQVFASSDHIDLLRGAVLTLPEAVVSHQSAAHLLAFPKLPRLEPTVVVASHTTHRFPGVRVRRCSDLDRRHITLVQQLPVTNVTRTTFDLAGVLEERRWDAIAEAVLIDGRLRIQQLESIADELCRRGKPGSRLVKDFIASRYGTDPRATELERRGRAILSSAGLPLPVPQFPIPWDPSRRFDDAYPNARLAIEWDSRAWHQQRAAMATDRKRDRQAALHGWLVSRFTWEEVTERPDTVRSTIASLLKERLRP